MTRWLTLFALLLLAGCASQPSRETPKAPRDFIEESAIDMPKALAAADLINTSRAGEDVGAGVVAYYRLHEHPDVALDLFVYPAGRMPAAIGLEQAQKQFVDGLYELERMGVFEALHVSQAPFTVPLGDGQALEARKSTLSMRKQGEDLDSRAWVTYRQHFFFKLRMSLRQGGDLARIDALGDAAARELFARAQVTSIGGCGDIQVIVVETPLAEGVDPVAADGSRVVMPLTLDPMLLATHIETAETRLRSAGCALKSLPATPAGFQRQTLSFKPGTWIDEP